MRPGPVASGSVLVVVLVVCLGLVSLALVLGHSMLMAYRGADNELAGRQADAATLGARAIRRIAHGQRHQSRATCPTRRRTRARRCPWATARSGSSANRTPDWRHRRRHERHDFGQHGRHRHQRRQPRPTHLWPGGRGFQAQPQQGDLRDDPPTAQHDRRPRAGHRHLAHRTQHQRHDDCQTAASGHVDLHRPRQTRVHGVGRGTRPRHRRHGQHPALRRRREPQPRPRPRGNQHGGQPRQRAIHRRPARILHGLQPRIEHG